VTIFDTVTNRVAQTVTVANGPYEIGFTDAQAYIRRRDSEIVTAIPLAPLRADGRSAGLAEFPVGEKPATADTSRTLTAASMVASPVKQRCCWRAPVKRAVRYYREGMAAPADSFDNFGHQPVAVTIVDRSLRQTAPGTYSAVTRLLRAGATTLVVLVDKPRVAHCFAFDVAARSGDTATAWAFEPVTLPQTAPAGRPVTLSFRVVRRSPSERLPEPSAITALAILAPGSWHERVPMVRAADGTWGMQFVPPAAGIYLLAFEAPRQGIHVDASPHFTIDVTEPEPLRANMSRIAAWCGLAVVLVLGPTLARGQSPDLGRAAPLDIPDVVLVDHNGTSHRVVRDLIRGKIAVVSFVFTGCTTICSRLAPPWGRSTSCSAPRSARGSACSP